MRETLEFIKGMNFAPFQKRGTLEQKETMDSFHYMLEHTGSNFIILSPSGLQNTAHAAPISIAHS